MTNTTKATNPKDALGSDKLPIHLWPVCASIYGSLGLMDGMLKYGRSNWRPGGARFSIYFDAAMRHSFALWEGIDIDPESGLPQECHILACWAIILDARLAGTLTDDRAYECVDALKDPAYLKFVASMTPHVARLKAQYANLATPPKHWTIEDRRGTEDRRTENAQ
jgi:hypothetical protein